MSRSRSSPSLAGSIRLVALVLCALVELPGQAVELASASHRHRAGAVVAFSAGGHAAMSSTASDPTFGAVSASLGEPMATALAGSEATGEAVLPGYWPIVSGAAPGLDQDGDDLPWFLDPDDDGDGLLDIHESSSGEFISPTDTGTSPFEADSDGDGFSDGFEVGNGSDPNDHASTPGAPGVAASGSLTRALLLAALLVLGLLVLVPTRRLPS